MALPDSTPTIPASQYAPFPTYLVSQRASSDQASTLYTAAVSTAYNSAQLGQAYKTLSEICQTLTALGFWKGAA